MTLAFVGMLVFATAMLLVSTAMARVPRRAGRRAHRPRLSASPSTAVALRGEALFATGLEGGSVLLDCLLGQRSGNGARQPVSLRVRRADGQDAELLPRVVQVWAERGDRVFVELSLGTAGCRARLCCGERSMTVAVDNASAVWRDMGRTATAA